MTFKTEHKVEKYEIPKLSAVWGHVIYFNNTMYTHIPTTLLIKHKVLILQLQIHTIYHIYNIQAKDISFKMSLKLQCVPGK
jgi:hypothetical protein